MKKLRNIIILILALCLLTSCLEETRRVDSKINPEIFEYRRGFIQNTKKNLDKLVNKDIENKLFKELSLEDSDNYELLDILRMFDYDDAKEDIDYLFELLQKTYGGYMAFGGEERFNEAREDILSELKPENNSVLYILNTIKANLTFIEDSHFSIDNSGLRNNYKTNFIGDYEFDKREDGYYLMDTDLKLRDDRDYESALKPSIDENGEIVYKLFYKSIDEFDNPQDKYAYLEFTDGSYKNLYWTSLDNLYHMTDTKARMDFNGDIPIFRLKRCYDKVMFESEKERQYTYSLNQAKELSKYNVAVLDLRGNSGGSAYFTRQWIRNYVGEEIGLSSDAIIYGGIGESSLIDKIIRQIFDFSQGKIINTKEVGIYEDGHIVEYGSDKVVEKDGILFVLIDGHTSSGGEWLLDMLRHMSNTLVIGTPTSGSMVGSINQIYRLPNSNIEFKWGNMYIDISEDYFKEYYGYEPDIWNSSVMAEERLFKLIENLDLNSADNLKFK